MKRWLFPVLILGLALSGCDRDSPTGPNELSYTSNGAGPLASASDRLCDAPEVEPVLEFANERTAEGVAVSQDGDVFVGNTLDAEIWRAPRGDFDQAYLLAELPGEVIGMDVDRVGNLYVGVALPPNPAVHGIWKVQPDGNAYQVAALPPFSLANDVAIDPRGNVYASDSFNGRIWRLAPDGELSEWIVDDLLRAYLGPFEFGVNGLVYHDWALYAAITLNGRVIRIPIQADGSAGTPAMLIENAELIGIDGIELDVQGNVYVANNFASTIQVIRADGLAVETITGEGLSAPASLAFNLSHTAIYVANLSTSAGFPQPYAPALVQAEFPVPVMARLRACDSGN